MRGKLVPQDPSDEPASKLLERIAAEKAQLVKEKKIKKPKALPEISEEEKPFELPEGWEWSRIQNIGHDLGQKKPDELFSYIDVGAINKEFGVITEPSILNASDAPSRARKIVKKGTVIYSTVRPYLLNIAVIDKDFSPEAIASTAFAIIHPLSGVINSFIYRYLRSPSFVQYVESVQNGVAYPAINDKQFFNGVIPIPPTSEQHRIVAKVDELMALCDQLEQQTESQIEAQQTLVSVLLETLTTSKNHNELMQNWQRLSKHFDTLFTTEQSIDQLKQTILQLAVMGRLVPQDPTDEPASKLLERIAAEKAQLIADKKIKKQKALPPISDDEKPFELPEGWEWCRVDDVMVLKHGYAFKSSYFSEDSKAYILTTPGSFYETGGFRDRGNKTKYYDGPLDQEFIFKANDLIIPLTEQAPGLLGSAAFIPDDGKTYLHNQRLAKLTPYLDLVSKEYIYWYFNSPYLRSELARTCSGTTVRHSSPIKVQMTLFAIPPINEQSNIVAKVDELMAICDKLKSKLNQSQQTQLHLTDAIVEQVV
nr:restriction endonuclease subunit S [Vibrio litoralis]